MNSHRLPDCEILTIFIRSDRQPMVEFRRNGQIEIATVGWFFKPDIASLITAQFTTLEDQLRKSIEQLARRRGDCPLRVLRGGKQ